MKKTVRFISQLAKHKKTLIILCIFFGFIYWAFFSVPKLYVGSIRSITQLRFPYPQGVEGMIVEVRDKQTIRQYVEAFNQLSLRPILGFPKHDEPGRLPITIYAQNKVHLKWGFTYHISFIPFYNGKRVVQVFGRYFSIESGSYTHLTDILSQKGAFIPISKW